MTRRKEKGEKINVFTDYFSINQRKVGHQCCNVIFLCVSFCLFVLGLHPQCMEVPRLGVESQLQLPAYTTTTAMRDPSHICELHCSSQQCQILNPLMEAKDQTPILMDTSQVHYH